MKTAEEWDEAFDGSPKWGISNMQDFISAIQLDAMKEGARRAASIVKQRRDCYAKCESGWHYYDQSMEIIANASANWSVKDL